MRKYCSCICVGSKMKEIKLNQFLAIPFPKFDNKSKKKIVELFEGGLHHTVNDLLSDKKRLYEVGLYSLHKIFRQLQSQLDKKLDSIINETPDD